jgi:hypothetical protein
MQWQVWMWCSCRDANNIDIAVFAALQGVRTAPYKDNKETCAGF